MLSRGRYRVDRVRKGRLRNTLEDYKNVVEAGFIELLELNRTAKQR
jgi:hypothetical protein